MQKLINLRQYLIDSPLKIIEHDINIFADSGGLNYTAHPTDDNFKLKYHANIIFTNFNGNVNNLSFIILSWLKLNQPHLSPDAIKFDVDIIKNNKFDIHFSAPFSEFVNTNPVKNGVKISDMPDILVEKITLSNFYDIEKNTPIDEFLKILAANSQISSNILKIDDTTYSPISTYSSAKIENRLAKLNDIEIDDTKKRFDATYSSAKIENFVDFKVGDETTDLLSFFQNQLSKY